MVFERAANNAAPTEMMPRLAAAGADLKWFFTPMRIPPPSKKRAVSNAAKGA